MADCSHGRRGAAGLGGGGPDRDKVNQGLSDRHASVLAALRIRLKGSGGESLEDLLEAAEHLGPDSLERKLTETENRRKPTLDDLLGKEQAKPEWPSGERSDPSVSLEERVRPRRRSG